MIVEKQNKFTLLVLTVVTIIYISIGLIAGIWEDYWVLFMLVPIVWLFIEYKQKENKNIIILIVLLVFSFSFFHLVISFLTGMWNYTWILFLLLPITAWGLTDKK